MNTAATDFYVIGGTLRRDAPSYVKRRADDDLYDGLSAGQFCYVLTSRQMGKSSLMVRTAVRLRADGGCVAVLDLTSLGQNVTAEQWYQGLLGLIGEQLELENELEDFWIQNKQIGPLQRWLRAISEVVLIRKHGRVVIFVDEIDAVRSLQFSTDEFFAAIRGFYNRRAADSDMERLTFCLLGVATPSDLIRDIRTTPFNIGRRIELQDFTAAEAAPLTEGLGRREKIAAQILTRVLYWTEGHPYLTQRLCQALAEDQSVITADGVDRVCQELFLSARARERDDNLIFVRERVLRSEEAERISLLDLYQQVRKRTRVADDETNPVVSVLRLSGIVRVMRGYLYVRNRIYHQAFDQTWVRANMPDAELQRQRRAYRTGQMRAAAIAAVIITVLTGSVTVAALRERNRAMDATHRADQNAEIANKANVELQDALKKLETALGYANRQRDIADQQRDIANQESKQTEQERQKAEGLQKSAESHRLEAEKQRLLAEARSKEAVDQRLEAEDERQEAERLRTIAEKKLEEAEQQTAGDRANLLVVQGAYERAEELYRQYFNFLEKKYGPDHPSVAKVLISLAEVYVTQGRYAKAEPLYKDALSRLGQQHPDFVKVTESYAALLRKLQREKDAAALESQVRRVGTDYVTGSFEGQVVDMVTNEPIAGATVRFINKYTEVPVAKQTDADGRFRQGLLPPGDYVIIISKRGFKSMQMERALAILRPTVVGPVPLRLERE